MKVVVGLNIMVEVEINDKFKVLDIPYLSHEDADIPKGFYLDCADSAKKQVDKIYPHYKDLEVFGVYGAKTDNALVEFQAQVTEPFRPGKRL